METTAVLAAGRGVRSPTEPAHFAFGRTGREIAVPYHGSGAGVSSQGVLCHWLHLALL